ncbi:MAG: hypothetical protein ABR558_03870 [Thioalkalivibrio sp.]
MRRLLLRALCLPCLLAPLSLPAQAPERSLDADTWSRPRTAEGLVQLAPLRETVAALQADSRRTLLIRSPEGEQGELWASELRDWMVALGIPSARIDIDTDPALMGQLDLVIRP